MYQVKKVIDDTKVLIINFNNVREALKFMKISDCEVAILMNKKGEEIRLKFNY
jgi:hypothetical protein